MMMMLMMIKKKIIIIIITIILIITLIKVEYGEGWSSAYQEEVDDPAQRSLWLLVPAAPATPVGVAVRCRREYLNLLGNLPRRTHSKLHFV